MDQIQGKDPIGMYSCMSSLELCLLFRTNALPRAWEKGRIHTGAAIAQSVLWSGYGLGCRFGFRQDKDIFLFPKTSIQAAGPTQTHI